MRSPGYYNVLFFCMRNSARSIMAEGLLNQWGQGRFRAYSAGLYPNGHIHPLALATLGRHDLPTDGLRSKSWDEFVKETPSPVLHFVFTLCEEVARQQAPQWPGEPMTAQWSIGDPGSVAGSLEMRVRAFDAAFRALEARIKLFTQLRIEEVDRATLQRDLEAIGLPS